jgi:hypothetical protein
VYDDYEPEENLHLLELLSAVFPVRDSSPEMPEG